MFEYHYRKTTPEVKCKNQQNTIRRPVFLLYLKILHLKSPKTCLTAGFLVRPSGFPLSGINLESAAHSKKTCLTAGFFVVRPSGFEPLAYRVGVIRLSSRKPLWHNGLVGVAQICGIL